MNLIMFCYNFLRSKNILGFTKMLQTIKNWQPNYEKIVCALKNVFAKLVYNQNKPIPFFTIACASIFKDSLIKPCGHYSENLQTDF